MKHPPSVDMRMMCSLTRRAVSSSCLRSVSVMFCSVFSVLSCAPGLVGTDGFQFSHEEVEMLLKELHGRQQADLTSDPLMVR